MYVFSQADNEKFDAEIRMIQHPISRWRRSEKYRVRAFGNSFPLRFQCNRRDEATNGVQIGVKSINFRMLFSIYYIRMYVWIRDFFLSFAVAEY